MANPEIVQEQFDRLVAHSSRWLTEDEYDTLLADWQSTLKHLPDFAVVEAGDELMMLGKMPTLNDMLAMTQRYARDSAAGAFRPPLMPEVEPQPGDYAHQVIEEARRFLRAPDWLLDLPEPTEPEYARWTCPCGEMRGWVEVTDLKYPGTLVVRPCERCRPDAYAKWREDVTR